MAAAGGAAARAQSFNLDAGPDDDLPPAGYGGAADQPGQWQALSFNVEQTVPLMDIAGEATAVTLTAPLPFGPAAQAHDGPSGGDEALLEDYLDLHSTPASLDLVGLQPGRYTIYTYAWAPDDSRYATLVTVGDVSQEVGGAWSGALEEGVTHARHEVVVAAGDTVSIYTFGRTKGTLNGIQIVAEPATGEPAPEASAEAAPEDAPVEPSPEPAAEGDAGATSAEGGGCGAAGAGADWIAAALALAVGVFVACARRVAARARAAA